MDERKLFDAWYINSTPSYDEIPIGSHNHQLQWEAWSARAELIAQFSERKFYCCEQGKELDVQVCPECAEFSAAYSAAMGSTTEEETK